MTRAATCRKRRSDQSVDTISRVFLMQQEPDAVTAPQQPTSDVALMSDMVAGSERALSVVYDRYSGMLFGILVRILKDQQAAEEVLQDLFLQLWRNAARFDASRGSLPAWLLVIARNRAISRLRTRRNRELVAEEEDDYAATFISSQNIEEETYRTELTERVKAALVQLPAEQRQALELAYFEGMTQSEIAAATSSPLGTVKTRVRTAMQSLKRLLDDRRAR